MGRFLLQSLTFAARGRRLRILSGRGQVMTTHGQLLGALIVLACVYCVASAAPAAPEVPSLSADASRVIPPTPDGWPRVAIERATRAADDIRDPYRRAEALASIARAQAGIEDASATDKTIHRALEASRQVPQAEFRGWVLHDIVLAQIAADDLYGARQLAERIEAERPQGAAVAAVAERQLLKGDLSAARASAYRIREEASRGLVLRQITAIEAGRGQVDEANATAKSIDDVFYRALACGDVAAAEVHRGNLDGALAQAARARRAYRAPVFGRIAVAQHDVGDMAGAFKTLPKIDDELHRAVVQARIGALRAAAGDSARAQALFAAALAGIDAAREERDRVPAVLAQVGRLQAASGYREDASKTLQRAFTEAGPLAPGEPRDDALDSIARGQAKIGETDAALGTAKLVGDRVARALLIRDAISMQGKAADRASVAREAAAFSDPLADAAAQFGLLGTQLTRHNHAAARETIYAARDAVRNVQDVEFSPPALAALAAAAAATGDAAAGRSIFEEAIGAADSIERQDRRAAAYVRIANALNDRLVFLGQPMKKPGDDTARGKPTGL
jgi:predicted negative regulator of RcsB-dependent stress response